MLNDITPEQRQQYLEQGRIARQEKALFAQEHLDTDHGEDGKHWAYLSKKVGFRMPAWYHSNQETKYIKRLFKHVGIDIKEYLEDCGVTTLKSLNDMNPQETAYASVGFALEWIDEYGQENKC